MSEFVSCDKQLWSPRIEILLATYNGGRYLTDLLESLVKQTYNNWSLRVADDGSHDDTTTILNNFRVRFPHRVTLEVNKSRIGAAKNFLNLMRNSTCEFVAFCDQDDVWLPHKLETLYGEIKKKYADNTTFDLPVVVYSDAVLVDTDLELIHPSLFRYNRTNEITSRVYYYLRYKNFITGCTVLSNRAAITIALEMACQKRCGSSGEILMHDHWLGLVVSKVGGLLIRVNSPLILYRQHGANLIGMGKQGLSLRALNKKLENIREKYRMLRLLEDDLYFPTYLFRHIIFSLFR